MYSLPGSKQRILLPQKHKTICFKPEIKETQRLRHAKALHPFHQKFKPISTKCLEYALSSSSSESEGECENNKSCHCRDCGHQSKKMKHMKRNIDVLVLQCMEGLEKGEISQNKIQKRCLCHHVDAKVSNPKKEETNDNKKIIRMKTKFFEPSPEPPQQNQQIIYLEPIQPVQVQMIDFKHKQRQSIVNYLNNKLQDSERHADNYQLSLPKVRQQNNLSSSHSKLLLKPLKTQNDEGLTPQRNNLRSIIHKANPSLQSSSSPYLKQPPLTTRIRSLQNRLYLSGRY